MSSKWCRGAAASWLNAARYCRQRASCRPATGRRPKSWRVSIPCARSKASRPSSNSATTSARAPSHRPKSLKPCVRTGASKISCNQLHWVLDVTLKEDASTVRKDNAPENLSLIKKIVLNLFRMDTTDTVKSSLQLKRKRADWDDELRTRFLGLTPIGCPSAEAMGSGSG